MPSIQYPKGNANDQLNMKNSYDRKKTFSAFDPEKENKGEKKGCYGRQMESNVCSENVSSCEIFPMAFTY